jgi:hypothetical protein
VRVVHVVKRGSRSYFHVHAKLAFRLRLQRTSCSPSVLPFVRKPWLPQGWGSPSNLIPAVNGDVRVIAWGAGSLPPPTFQSPWLPVEAYTNSSFVEVSILLGGHRLILVTHCVPSRGGLVPGLRLLWVEQLSVALCVPCAGGPRTRSAARVRVRHGPGSRVWPQRRLPV